MWIFRICIAVLFIIGATGLDLLTSCKDNGVDAIHCLHRVIEVVDSPSFCRQVKPRDLGKIRITKNIKFDLPFFNATVICTDSTISGLSNSFVSQLDYKVKKGFLIVVEHPNVNYKCKYNAVLYKSRENFIEGTATGDFNYGYLLTTLDLPLHKNLNQIDWSSALYFTAGIDGKTKFKFDDAYEALKLKYSEVRDVIDEMERNPIVLKREIIAQVGKLFTQQYLKNAICATTSAHN